MIDGRLLTFQEQGLYDGLFLLGDLETGTRWNHLTGEALIGPMVGETLPTEVVIHTTVGQVLASHPDALIAVSDHPRARAQSERGGTLSNMLDRIRGVPPMFPATLGSEDDRRDRMDIGIGIWDEERNARYYSMSDVDGAGGALLDELSGEPVVVYYDPSAHSLQALYTESSEFEWDDKTLRFDTGEYLEEGVLYNAAGQRIELRRPLQVFTRWYGFSLTFPEAEVFGR